MIKRSIGQNLREIRKAKEDQGLRITQKEVASAMGVRDKQVSKWENDQVQLSADQIVRLADFYGVSTDKLLRGGKAESLVMMNETGLSDQAIDRLRELRAKGKPEISELINLLFKPEKGLPPAGEMLLSAMYRFIHCDDLPVYDPTETGGKYIGSHADLDLLRIISELQEIRKSCQRSEDQESGSDDLGRDVYILDKTHLF